MTHIYCSPFFQAAPASTHGYDVVDPTRFNDELGGEEGFRAFLAELAKHGLRVLMDIVPNHMATAGPFNHRWWDILQRGRSSRYAGHFDIDWDSAMSNVKGKVLLGVLADRYGHEPRLHRRVAVVRRRCTRRWSGRGRSMPPAW